jgi:putative peptidoglycan lipid II flippase
VLLERGEFTGTSTDAVAFALQFYALGLFAHASIEIITRAFYALHDTRTPVAVGVVAISGNILLSLALVQTSLDFGGLALANSLATIAEMMVLLWLVCGRLGDIDEWGITTSLIRVGLATLLMAAAVTWLERSVETQGLVSLVSGAMLGGLIYVLATFLLGSPEIRSLGQLVRKRIPAASMR